MSDQKKVALVTGASKGIGRSISIALAHQGCDIVVNYRSDTQAAEQTAQAVEAAGALPCWLLAMSASTRVRKILLMVRSIVSVQLIF